MKEKLKRAKSKLKKHWPDLALGALAGAYAAAGWILAVTRQHKLDQGIMIPFPYERTNTKSDWANGTLVTLHSEDRNYIYTVRSKTRKYPFEDATTDTEN